MPLLILILLFHLAQTVQAYPIFIGYKYSSCLTCHFNGNGNGPLTDYGRALLAAEISDKMWSTSSDEELANASGFWGSQKLPWWIRPGIKGRQIFYQTTPTNSKWESITMQAEGNLAVFFDKKQSVGIIGSFGYVPTPRRFTTSGQTPGSEITNWISREHYLRVRATNSLWLYAGMTDKVYGVRHVNHTAYNRSYLGLGQNDQAHGVIAQYIQPSWEASLNIFAGNLFQTASLRQQGASLLMEYELKEAWRAGFTALSSTNEYIGLRRAGILTRYGFGKGSALLMEVGGLQNAPKGSTQKTGYYLYSEGMQRLVRGYHLFVTGQAYRESIEAGKSDNIKASLGVLAFLLQRLEFRVELENSRQLTSSSNVPKETWVALGQAHISL